MAMSMLRNKFFGFTYGYFFSRHFAVPETGTASR